MLSRRNLLMMLTIIAVVLVIFISPVIMKEYYNDYDVNHWAVEKPVTQNKQIIIGQDGGVLFFGAQDDEYIHGIKEWANYRKKAFTKVTSLYDAANTEHDEDYLLLVDGLLLQQNTKEYTEILKNYVTNGGILIFYRLPSYQTINASYELQDLLGIQRLRGEAVKLSEIRLYAGFLLGGETHYSFYENNDMSIVNIKDTVPWYDVSSRTKTYMAGFITAAEMSDKGVKNEDMPAIIWRSNMGSGSVFAVNGDYMKECAPGLIDAMVYETQEYSLYSVVNAQNLSITGFPDLTNENKKKMEDAYGMTTEQFCRDILWPTFVAAADDGGWKITSFITAKQNDGSQGKTKAQSLIDYLKYFNEEKAEAGISLGRINCSDLAFSIEDEINLLSELKLDYRFAAGYVRSENKEKFEKLLANNKYNFLKNINTVVGEHESDSPLVSWLSPSITLQNATDNAYIQSYMDSIKLKSTQTALAYSNVQIDIYRVLNPKDETDQWQNLANKMAANIGTYWKPFSSFQKTTISQSDARVRDFLNGSVKSTKSGNVITVNAEGFSENAYLLLRTHGEIPVSIVGGSIKKVEDNAYLIRLEENTANITLKNETEFYYR